MKVQHHYNERNGVFFIEENGQQIASMRYVFRGNNTFIIEHTEVKEGNEGKGIGKLLVKTAVDFARENNFKIIPFCPYAKAILQKTPEYQDVLN